MMKGSGRHCAREAPGDETVKKRGPSSLRDAKYRERLKNSVKLLESVLPLSKRQRSRQKLYEDALQLTAVLQESLFRLVNQLRIQNQENIYNFKIFTPSYVQASFVSLVQKVEGDMKNGTQMNAQLVEKVSNLALDFFTGLLRKCNYKLPWDRMSLCSDETLRAVPSSNSSNSISGSSGTKIQLPLLSSGDQDALIQGRTYIPDYMELDGITEDGLSMPSTTTTPLQRSYSQHKREKTAPVEKNRILRGAGRGRKRSCPSTHTPSSTTDTACTPNQKLRRLHTPKSKKQLFLDEGKQTPHGIPPAQSPCSSDDMDQHGLVFSSSSLSVGMSEHRQGTGEGNGGGGGSGGSGLQARSQNECYTVRVNTSGNKKVKSPEIASDRIRITGVAGAVKLSRHGSLYQSKFGSSSVRKTSTRVIPRQNMPDSTSAAPSTSGIHSNSSQDIVDKEKKNVTSGSLKAEILKVVTFDPHRNMPDNTSAATSTSRNHNSTSQETSDEEKKYVKSCSITAEILKKVTFDPHKNMPDNTSAATSTSRNHTSTTQDTRDEEKKYVKSGSLTAEILKDVTFDQRGYVPDSTTAPPSPARIHSHSSQETCKMGTIDEKKKDVKSDSPTAEMLKDDTAAPSSSRIHRCSSQETQGTIDEGKNKVKSGSLSAEILRDAAYDQQGNFSFLSDKKIFPDYNDCHSEVSLLNNSSWPLLQNSSLKVSQPNCLKNISLEIINNKGDEAVKVYKSEHSPSSSLSEMKPLNTLKKDDSRGLHAIDEEEALNRSCSNLHNEKLIQNIPKNDSKEAHADNGQEVLDGSCSNMHDEPLEQNLSLKEKLVVEQLISKDELCQQSHNVPDSQSSTEKNEKDPDAVKRSLIKRDSVESQGYSSNHWKMINCHLSTSYQHSPHVRDSENNSSTLNHSKMLNCRTNISYQHSSRVIGSENSSSTSDYSEVLNHHPNTSYRLSSPPDKDQGSNISTSDHLKLLNHHLSASYQHLLPFKDPGSTSSTSDHSEGPYHHPNTCYQHLPPIKDSGTNTSTSDHLKVLDHHLNTSYQHSPLIEDRENNTSTTDHSSTSYQHLPSIRDLETSSTSKSVGPGATDQDKRAREVMPIPTLANSLWSIITPKGKRRLCVQGAPRKPYKPTPRRCSPHCRRNLAKEFADGNLDALDLPYSPPFSPFREADMFKTDDFIILE